MSGNVAVVSGCVCRLQPRRHKASPTSGISGSAAAVAATVTARSESSSLASLFLCACVSAGISLSRTWRTAVSVAAPGGSAHEELKTQEGEASNKVSGLRAQMAEEQPQLEGERKAGKRGSGDGGGGEEVEKLIAQVEEEGHACASATRSEPTPSNGHEKAHVASGSGDDGQVVVGGGASPGRKRQAHDSLDAGESPDEWDPDSTELDASARARVMARASSTDSNAGQRPRGALLDAGGGGGKFCLGANAVNEEDPERDHATQV